MDSDAKSQQADDPLLGPKILLGGSNFALKLAERGRLSPHLRVDVRRRGHSKSRSQSHVAGSHVARLLTAPLDKALVGERRYVSEVLSKSSLEFQNFPTEICTVDGESIIIGRR